jgi:hypothetical protein
MIWEGYFWSHWNVHTYCYIDSSTNTFKHKECKATFFRSYTNNITFIHQIKQCSSHLGLLIYSSCTTKSMPNTIQIGMRFCKWVWFYNTKHEAPKTINGGRKSFQTHNRAKTPFTFWNQLFSVTHQTCIIREAYRLTSYY